MLYLKNATGSVILPKLIGAYEQELHPLAPIWDAAGYDHMVNVGAGEGYYAVGFCFRYPNMNVTAFESSSIGRRRIHKLAVKNRLGNNLNVRGHCTPDQLQTVLSEGSKVLLIVDVEGYEQVLLNPVQVPALYRTDVVAELHPEKHPEIETLLRSRFADTHRLIVIAQEYARTLPNGVRIPPGLLGKTSYLLNEFRGPQYWLVATVLDKHKT